MRKRYRAQWRRKNRLPPESLDTRTERRAAHLIRRALTGDTDALVTILKETGELPKDFKLRH